MTNDQNDSENWILYPKKRNNCSIKNKITNGQDNTEKWVSLKNGLQDTESRFLYHQNLIATRLKKTTNGSHDTES